MGNRTQPEWPYRKCLVLCAFSTLLQWTRALLFFLNTVIVCLLHTLMMLPLYPFKYILPQLYITLESFLYCKCGEAYIPVFSCFPKLRLHSDTLSVIEPLARKRALIMINHQESGDVPAAMCLIAYFNNSHAATWIMDRMFKWTPFGIPSQWHNDFFSVEGSRDVVVQSIRKHFSTKYFDQGRRWLAMFPEGGYLRNRGEQAREWARKNSLPVLYNCCLPRTTAFVNIVQAFRGDVCPVSEPVEDIVDVTFAYSGESDLCVTDVILGRYSDKDVFINFRAYKTSELPQDEEGITTWLYDRYQEKEELLGTFKETGVFTEGAEEFKQMHPPTWRLVGGLAFWYISAFFVYDFYTSLLSRLLCFFSGFV